MNRRLEPADDAWAIAASDEAIRSPILALEAIRTKATYAEFLRAVQILRGMRQATRLAAIFRSAGHAPPPLLAHRDSRLCAGKYPDNRSS